MLCGVVVCQMTAPVVRNTPFLVYVCIVWRYIQKTVCLTFYGSPILSNSVAIHVVGVDAEDVMDRTNL